MLLQVLYIISEILMGNRDKQKNYSTPTNLIVLLYNYSTLPPNFINMISRIYLRWSGMSCKFSLSNKSVQEQEFHPVQDKGLLFREYRSLLRRKEATTSSVFHKRKARQLNLISETPECGILSGQTYVSPMSFVTKGQLLIIRFPVVEPTDSSMAKPQYGLPQSDRKAEGAECHSGLSLPACRSQAPEDLSAWLCVSLGRGDKAPSPRPDPPALLRPSVSVSVVQGLPQPHSQVPGVSQCCLAHKWLLALPLAGSWVAL